MVSPSVVIACSGTPLCAWGRDGKDSSKTWWQAPNWWGAVSKKMVWFGTSGPSAKTTRVFAAGLKGRDVSREDQSRTKGNSNLSLAPAEDGVAVVSLPRNVDYISSLGNSYVKHLVKLRRNAATRHSTSSVLVMGTIPLREICESVEFDAEGQRGPNLINVLLVRDDAETPGGLTRFSQRVVRVSVAVMSKITGLDSPPEALGVLSYPSSFTTLELHQDKLSANSQMQKWCPSPRRILVLDAIQDPGNLGTLIRTAAAFAWDGLFLLPGCCDPFNEKALRASRGACFRVPIAVGDWHHVQKFAVSNSLELYAGDPEPVSGSREIELKMPGTRNSERGDDSGADRRFLLDMDAGITNLKPLTSFQQGLCLVLGSEGQGLSDHIVKDCIPVGIPMPGKYESLNVAVAGGILMFLLR
ncbi:hypothetical protein Mapa_008695 [Marchantia paleacea]|nr:hypothetical protein Mapa_008695 [Marchantia paleacea]